MELNSKINELINSGKDVINLTVGEPNYYEPSNAAHVAIEAINEHFTHYTSTPGILSLRQAIVKKLKEDNQLDFSADQIVVSNGGKQALYNTLAVLLNEGDEVLIPTPAWPSYASQVELLDGVPKEIPLSEDTGFKLTPDLLEKNCSPKTKLIILNSPSNPTGATYTSAEFKALVPIIEKHKLLVISDEIYEKLVYDMDYVSPLNVSQYIRENSILINGFSKAFGMTGWRIGYTAAPIEVSKKIAAFQSQTTANINSIAQKAAEVALANFEIQHVAELKRNRDILFKAIQEDTDMSLDDCPNGAFYLFPNIKGLIGKTYGGQEVHNSQDFCHILLKEAGIGITPGDVFDAPNNVRISYAKDLQTIKTVRDRLISFFEGEN
ncbi:pyridoxal phosphate-dependent aminotransferase [Agrilactobacillus composti]|uniref:pyridoxal phosphate-dependent aminotransferase n=1 Tax=Agrilactobacillus composti TaxID=398555 RepID=UPI000A614375|nr:pyridoxal phosphate-dependent aminotransferase [Agrilactobacillus composti]